MITLTAQENRVALHMRALFMGQDLCILLDGGHKPHIGAVSTAHPDKQETFCLPSHKEDILATDIALTLQQEFGCTVTCLCGIHLQDITRHEIDVVYRLSQELVQKLIHEIQFFLREPSN